MPPLRRTLARPSAAAFAAVVLGCGSQDLPVAPPLAPAAPPSATPSASASAAAFEPPAVTLPSATEGVITQIQSKGDVPLVGHRVDAKPGDWMLRGGGHVAVVSVEGRVVDFGPEKGRDELVGIDPIAFLGLDAPHFEVQQIEAAGDGKHVLHVTRRMLEKPLLLHTFVHFSGKGLAIETAVVAASPKAEGIAVTLGERVGWGNVPTWVEGHGFVGYAGTFIGDFVARESLGVAYALCSQNGRIEARIGGSDPPGFYDSARTGEEPVAVTLDAPTRRRTVALAYSTRSLGDAALSLPCVRRGGGDRAKVPEGLPRTAKVETARCGTRGRAPAPYARFSPEEQEIALPQGCFQMRLTAPGHTASAWFSTTASFGRTLPPAGRIRFAAIEHGGGALPARVLVRGLKGTADPDWGDDPDAGAALNVIYADKGEGERPLPPGKYKVTIDRGFEYTALEKEITVVANRTSDVRAELRRVVDTKGWIAADLHLHAVPSPDAPQPLADRVRALAAAGIEVGVATDHNAVTDYAQAIKELGLGARVASIVGDEVTTRDPYYGHFNVFPLAAGAAPIPWRNTSPRDIFAAAHAAAPYAADTIVQVNHPRMGDIGYFDLLHLDRDDVAGWTRRAPLADLGFDALEVFNGDHYARIDKVEECMRDWYALLNAGRRVTATGNSDSHKLAFHEAGAPRNLVALAKDDPAALDERAFVNAVRSGKVVVSSGPFVTLEAGGKGVGESIGEGSIEVTIRVDAPPWVDVDRVELVRRGDLIRVFTPPFPKGPHRFERKITETLRKGDWLVAIARGTKPMTFLYRPHARPFGFTNPIFVE